MEDTMIAVRSNLRQLWYQPEKESGFNGIWTQDLRVTGAMLYQLNYEAIHVGSWSICGFYQPSEPASRYLLLCL